MPELSCKHRGGVVCNLLCYNTNTDKYENELPYENEKRALRYPKILKHPLKAYPSFKLL